MADVTGALHHEFAGKTYTLRLTMAGIAALQDKHGNDLGGLLTGGTQGIPPFALLIDIVIEALVKGEKMQRDEAEELADDLLTADQTLAVRILNASFPDVSGNAKAPSKRKA